MREELLPRFVEIPAGAFTMGAADGEEDEQPVRAVTLDRFHIAMHPVTNAQYAEFVRNTGHRAPDVRDLATHVADGRLDLAALPALDDAEVIRALTAVRGIGTWTAEVFLIFQLQRPDVFPAADLALLTAIQRIYRKRTRPTPAQARALAERWRPYRSIASWYLWRSIEP